MAGTKDNKKRDELYINYRSHHKFSKVTTFLALNPLYLPSLHVSHFSKIFFTCKLKYSVGSHKQRFLLDEDIHSRQVSKHLIQNDEVESTQPIEQKRKKKCDVVPMWSGAALLEKTCSCSIEPIVINRE